MNIVIVIDTHKIFSIHAYITIRNSLVVLIIMSMITSSIFNIWYSIFVHQYSTVPYVFNMIPFFIVQIFVQLRRLFRFFWHVPGHIFKFILEKKNIYIYIIQPFNFYKNKNLLSKNLNLIYSNNCQKIQYLRNIITSYLLK